MSEQLKNGEQLYNHEQTSSPEVHKHVEKAETDKGFTGDELEQIRSSIENKAETSKDKVQEQINKATEQKDDTPSFIGKDLIDMAFSRTMTRVRKQLSAPDRAFSKIIHQPLIDKVSDFGAKTVARPSALFTGGFVSFGGTFVYYYIARHYGYQYNFSVFIFLLISGMITGVVVEVIWNLIKRYRS